MLSSLLVLFMISYCSCENENVLQTEVFKITIHPSMFNWTYHNPEDEFIYQTTLQNSPDLPSWLNFVYSPRHQSAYIYGVAPKDTYSVSLDIVALNKKSYETRLEQVQINIEEKLNPAQYEVHLKIDNVNVVDMFSAEKMDSLKDIFRKQLWKDSDSDLYVTFLNSALDLGARKPANPFEGEGIVIKLGSQEPFSNELLELQEEIKPLWKVPSCPRDFKRTSVEIYFRDAGFALDWCLFRLIGDNNTSLGVNEKLSYQDDVFGEFQTTSREEIPKRNYLKEGLYSVLMPGFLVILFVSVLSFILCFNHESLKDEISEDFFNNLFHICTDYKDDCIRNNDMDDISLSDPYDPTNRELYSINNDTCLSPEPVLFSLTNSPTATLNHGVHCRPSPPPYVRPQFKPEL